MTSRDNEQQPNQSNTEKDPANWVTGDEPMTGAQASYLRTLSGEASETFDENLTKAQASQRIDELQQRTGRGSDDDSPDAIERQAGGSNTEKDPANWVTGDEPMTGAQASYLRTLSEEANEAFDENLTKAQASQRIDELQQRTGRGTQR